METELNILTIFNLNKLIEYQQIRFQLSAI